MNCTCRARRLADRCANCRADAQARRRMVDNSLTAAARNWDVTDDDWCQLATRLTGDDLHLLLEQETP